MIFEKVTKNLEKNGFKVTVFKTKEEASQYLNSEIDNSSVGFGGSTTAHEMELFESLGTHNEVWWHNKTPEGMDIKEVFIRAMLTDNYISSVNGLAETGELINIDNTGNRVASTLYGHKKVYFIIGKNKLAPDYDSALYRARNIASPLNVKRLNRKTPCATTKKCMDCNSPDRICRALVVLYKKPAGSDYEIILIDENLGY